MYSFPKNERLRSRKVISELFNSGKRFSHPPFKIFWKEMTLSTTGSAKVAIAVPKKKFKKAVDRNLLKRRIREAYRKNNYNFIKNLEKNNNHIAIVILYLNSEILSYKDIESKIKEVFERFD